MKESRQEHQRQSEAMGQCTRGDACSFRHDEKKRGKAMGKGFFPMPDVFFPISVWRSGVFANAVFFPMGALEKTPVPMQEELFPIGRCSFQLCRLASLGRVAGDFLWKQLFVGNQLHRKQQQQQKQQQKQQHISDSSKEA